MSVLNRFTETYRKFYFHDIQAITIERRPPLAFSILSVAILILAALVAALAPNDVVPYILVPAVAAIAVMAGTHLALGPLCVFRMHTAVQSVEVRCVGRLRSAERLLEKILPLVHAAQSDIVVQGTDRPVRAAAQSASNTALALRFDAGWLHVVFFALLAANAVSGLSNLMFESSIKEFVDIAMSLVGLVLNVFCLVRQRGSTLPQLTRWLTWTELILTGVSVFALSTSAGIISGLDVERTNPFEAVDLTQSAFYPYFVAITAGVDVVIALAGLASLGFYRAKVSKMARDEGAR